MTAWITTPLARTAKRYHYVAHLPGGPADEYGTVHALCTPYLALINPCRPPRRHGYCVGCLAATAESPDWCITDLQILRQVAEPWVLSRLITDPDGTAKQLVARTAGASSHGSGWAWCRDGLRIWRNKQPGAKVLDMHTPDRLLAWTDLRAHAAQHSTAEQTWWLHELTAWERHWWTEGLAEHQTGDKDTGWAHGRRHRSAQLYQHALAYLTWADDTLSHQPVQLDLLTYLDQEVTR